MTDTIKKLEALREKFWSLPLEYTRLFSTHHQLEAAIASKRPAIVLYIGAQSGEAHIVRRFSCPRLTAYRLWL